MHRFFYLFILGVLPLRAEKETPVVFERQSSADGLTSQNLHLGEDALFMGKLNAVGDASAPLTLQSGPVQSWQKSYQFTYRQKVASFLDLEFSPQLLFGAQPAGAHFRSATEADYFKRQQGFNMVFKPVPAWTVRGFSEQSEWQSLDTLDAKKQQNWGVESLWNATKWTKFRSRGQQGSQEESLTTAREQNSRIEIELTQKLGETPFQLKFLKGWEDQSDVTTGVIQRYVPKTEGVFSYAPSDATALSMGLRMTSTEEPLAGKNVNQQTLFGEWNQGVTSRVGIRLRASHESISEIDTGTVNSQLERTHFVFGPQVKLNDDFKAQMEFRLTDEQNRQLSTDRVDQGVSLSIQGKF
jgi:hypothetical protein